MKFFVTLSIICLSLSCFAEKSDIKNKTEKSKKPTRTQSSISSSVTEIVLREQSAKELCQLLKMINSSNDETTRSLVLKNTRSDGTEVYRLNGASYLTCIGEKFKVLVPTGEIEAVQHSQ